MLWGQRLRPRMSMRLPSQSAIMPAAKSPLASAEMPVAHRSAIASSWVLIPGNRGASMPTTTPASRSGGS